MGGPVQNEVRPAALTPVFRAVDRLPSDLEFATADEAGVSLTDPEVATEPDALRARPALVPTNDAEG